MIDLWIIDKFNILPTDKRFIDLFDEQKIAIFEGVCSLPDHKMIKKNILLTKKIEEIENKNDSIYMPKGLKETLEKKFGENGRSKDEINEMIKNMINSKKQNEIDKLTEGIFNG